MRVVNIVIIKAITLIYLDKELKVCNKKVFFSQVNDNQSENCFADIRSSLTPTIHELAIYPILALQH